MTENDAPAPRPATKVSQREKAETTDQVAREILSAELAARESKTARLKQLRLEQAAEPDAAPAKGGKKAPRRKA